MTKHNEIATKVSSKGQIVIPVNIRKKMNLKNGDKVIFTQENGKTTIKKMPTTSEWNDIIKNIPNEKVDIDRKGNYDAKKSPNFDKWMREG